ncbi:hypothetical protein RISK_001748 [Rhodopirellula islandica]|uniref:Uncharacterized protein n=1 Tax=Rhodopirellula islandica TaxID=595434 RepID=A0A0J1BJ40_RHOIS|nr:hypothetical protein RISK_001748 [Rhodopirellula islandica]
MFDPQTHTASRRATKALGFHPKGIRPRHTTPYSRSDDS